MSLSENPCRKVYNDYLTEFHWQSAQFCEFNNAGNLLLVTILATSLHAAFTGRGPQSAKKDSQLKQLIALMGSVGIKAASKLVDEIDPWSQFYPTHFIFKKAGSFYNCNFFL